MSSFFFHYECVYSCLFNSFKHTKSLYIILVYKLATISLIFPIKYILLFINMFTFCCLIFFNIIDLFFFKSLCKHRVRRWYSLLHTKAIWYAPFIAFILLFCFKIFKFYVYLIHFQFLPIGNVGIQGCIFFLKYYFACIKQVLKLYFYCYLVIGLFFIYTLLKLMLPNYRSLYFKLSCF